jgi:hypothetical protein
VSGSGESDPGLTSLYPESNEPEEHHMVLVRHARQIEMGVVTSRNHWQAIKNLTTTLDRTNALLEQQEMREADRALQEARKDHSIKRMTAMLGFGGAIVGALAMVTAAYLTHKSPEPEPVKQLSPAIEKAYEAYQRDVAKRRQPPSTIV